MKLFKFDTHVHTSEVSRCGKVAAADMITMYKNAGYSGVVITDHYSIYTLERFNPKNWDEFLDNYLAGYNIALEEGKKQGLQVILGVELTFEGRPDDYLVYGVDEKFLRENIELHKMGLENFRALIKDKGIIIVQAHPFRPNLKQAPPHLLDGIEVYNGNPRHNSSNELAMEYAEKNGLYKLSGSDFHQTDDLARGGIVLSEMIGSPAELVDVIVNNRIKDLIMT